MAGLYLPHDLDAVTDDKIVEMLGALDWYGYGLYWRLLEMLYTRTDHKLTCNYKGLSKIIGCDAGTLEQLVTEFGLFVIDCDCGQFYSERVLAHCESMESGRQSKADAGRKGAAKRWQTNGKAIANDSRPMADLWQTHNSAIADPMANDSTRMANDSNINLNNNLNLNNAADAALIAAAAEQKIDTQTVAPDVQQLLDAIGKRFNTIPLPVHLTALEALISECNRPGVVNGLDVVRDGLAKMDSAEAINERRVTLTMSQFLQPKYFMRLLGGDYDKVYKSKRKSGAWQDAGVSFENMDY